MHAPADSLQPRPFTFCRLLSSGLTCREWHKDTHTADVSCCPARLVQLWLQPPSTMCPPSGIAPLPVLAAASASDPALTGGTLSERRRRSSSCSTAPKSSSMCSVRPIKSTAQPPPPLLPLPPAWMQPSCGWMWSNTNWRPLLHQCSGCAVNMLGGWLDGHAVAAKRGSRGCLVCDATGHASRQHRPAAPHVWQRASAMHVSAKPAGFAQKASHV